MLKPGSYLRVDLSLLLSFVVLYLGPDALLPLFSALAAIVGVFMMFWRFILGIVKKSYRYCSRKVSQIFTKE